MDEREFVRQRQPAWDRLSAILEKASGRRDGLRLLSRDEVRDLAPLYRRAASDLAYARSHAITGSLARHLNSLAARSYSLLYQTDTSSWAGLGRFFVFDFPDVFRRRFGFFLVSVLAILAGGVVAYLLVAGNRERIDLFVPPGHPFRESLDHWMTGQTSGGAPDAKAALFASRLMTNNIRVSFAAFALGIAGGVGTVALLVSNGLLLGAFVGMMTHAGRHDTFWPGIVPHGVVEISDICIASAAGLSMGWALLAPGPYRRRDALVLAARDSVKLVLGGMALLVFAGLVEAFISHSGLPASLKYLFGGVSGVALYAYLGLSGRGRSPDSGRRVLVDTVDDRGEPRRTR